MEARKLKAQSQGVTCLTGWLVAAEKGAAGTPARECSGAMIPGSCAEERSHAQAICMKVIKRTSQISEK